MIDDLSKYKRLFVFGCSYTNYKWPTWANILSQDIGENNLYNFGRNGGSNLLVSLRVPEANRRYKFTESDLVIVMWTAATREERYVWGTWLGWGNIYTSFNEAVYSQEWLKKYGDPDGFLIRDMALIESTTQYLKSLPCKSIFLKSFDIFENQSVEKIFSKEIHEKSLELYSHNVADIPVAFNAWLRQYRNGSPNTYTFSYKDDQQTQMIDHHPDPVWHYKYLAYLRINVSDKAKKYAFDSLKLLEKCKTDSEISKTFEHINPKYEIFGQ